MLHMILVGKKSNRFVCLRFKANRFAMNFNFLCKNNKMLQQSYEFVEFNDLPSNSIFTCDSGRIY